MKCSYFNRRLLFLLCFIYGTLCIVHCQPSTLYQGRVVDEQGVGLMYATVYVQSNPIVGTATNADGYFRLENVDLAPTETLVLSCVGYQTCYVEAARFLQDSVVIGLPEQPILLTPTTVEAKKTRQSKRKRLATILHECYVRLQEESSSQPIRFHVVSDVKMEAQSSSWGMEQMVAQVVQIPSKDITKADSMQFKGTFCKRYCNPVVREHANQLLSGEQDKDRKRLAMSIDSGTVVHRKLWEMSQIDKSAFLDISDELARWQMTKQDEQHLILTHTRKRDYIGIVVINESHSLLVDNSASLQTYMQNMHVKVFLPFSIRVKDSDLEWLNLLNIDDEHIDKFRLKKADLTIHFETRYDHRDGILVPSEKTMHVQGFMEDNKKRQLPCELWGKQQITSVETQGVRPFSRYRKSQTVPRVLVPIY
ncbi:MAG: carboxypeptidase-like regulatory domain-containing protein [Paludibacteraceae bacterium]|nr:carboxypeptidase-like regulatory domain-containing protein [Paludibacteraceae bacterium]